MIMRRCIHTRNGWKVITALARKIAAFCSLHVCPLRWCEVAAWRWRCQRLYAQQSCCLRLCTLTCNVHCSGTPRCKERFVGFADGLDDRSHLQRMLPAAAADAVAHVPSTPDLRPEAAPMRAAVAPNAGAVHGARGAPARPSALPDAPCRAAAAAAAERRAAQHAESQACVSEPAPCRTQQHAGCAHLRPAALRAHVKDAPIDLQDSQDAAAQVLPAGATAAPRKHPTAPPIALDECTAGTQQRATASHRHAQAHNCAPTERGKPCVADVSPMALTAPTDLTDSPPQGLAPGLAAPASGRLATRRRLFAESSDGDATAAVPERQHVPGGAVLGEGGAAATGAVQAVHALPALAHGTGHDSFSTGFSAHASAQSHPAGASTEVGSPTLRLGRTKAERLRQTGAAKRRASSAAPGADPTSSAAAPDQSAGAAARQRAGAAISVNGVASEWPAKRPRADVVNLC